MLLCTFMNQGTPFEFHPHQEMWRFSYNKGRVSALRMHCEIALDAIRAGKKDIFILSPNGTRLSEEDLKECIETNRLPDNVMPRWMKRAA